MSALSTSTVKKSRVKTFLVWLMLLVLIATGVWWFWFKPDAEATAKPQGVMTGSPRRGGSFMGAAVPVHLAEVLQSEFIVKQQALGTVTAWQQAEVTSQVSGPLQAVHFKEGDWVEQGVVLAQIDPRPFQAALDQAQGSLQEMQAQLKNAEQELKRYQGLFKDDSIARQTYENQQSQVNQLRASVVSRQAQVKTAQLNLDYAKITAPISGYLGLRQVDTGNHLTAGSTVLVSITQMNPIAVNFTIPEQQLNEVWQAYTQQQKLMVEAWSRDETLLLAEGTLQSIDNQVDSSTGSVRLKAAFDNQQQTLFPNQFVNVRLHTKTLADALLMPADAIQFGVQGTFAWVVDDELTVSIRPITVGPSDGVNTVVLSGLAVGEKVVVEGVDRLRTGSKVEPVQPPANESEEPAEKSIQTLKHTELNSGESRTEPQDQ